MRKFVPILILFFFIGGIYNIIAQTDNSVESKTTIGGYGELHFNYVKSDNAKKKQTLDFNRFGITFLHRWSEQWSFKAGVELQHNIVEEGKGKITLEEANVNYQPVQEIGLQAGVVLLPVGLMNESNEPPHFFGVKIPDYNMNLIPTRWFGNGVAVYGLISGFDYKIVVMEGLNSDKFKLGSGISEGRQEGFMVNANKLLYSGRLDYIGLTGLRAGASFTFNEAEGDSTKNTIALSEFHAKYNVYNIYANFEIGNIAYGSGLAESTLGYYADLGYDFSGVLNITTKIIPFIRWSDYYGVASSRGVSELKKQYHYKQWMAGISVMPIGQIVFKADYSEVTRELDKSKTKLFNIGIGYVF